MSTVPPMVYPGSPLARRNDLITSHEAADLTDTAASQLEVMRILAHAGRPLSDGEIYREHLAAPVLNPWSFSDSRLRTARHELVEDGHVVEAGVGRTSKGRRCKTWAAVTA